MAKRVIWSARAQKERSEILKYWVKRNKSKTYSQKLNKLFNERIENATLQPEAGMATDDPATRILIVRDYFIYYDVYLSHIEILTIWDNRRNPDSFRL
jgi:plasmid stabilization system protein ParE